MPIYKVKGQKDGKQKYNVRINYIDILGAYKQIPRVAYGKEEAKQLEYQLEREIKENGLYFIQNNQIEYLNKKELEYYLAVTSYFSKTHTKNRELLLDSLSLNQEFDKVTKIRIFDTYKTYSKYISLSRKERESLDRIVDDIIEKGLNEFEGKKEKIKQMGLFIEEKTLGRGHYE